MADSTELLQSYKISTSLRDIYQILDRSHEAQSSLMWQTLPDHRTIFKFQNFILDTEKKKIIISYSGNEFINPNFPVYVKLPFREMVFKGKVVAIDTKNVTLNIPKEIHVRDLRENLRTNFKEGEKFAHIKPSMTFVSSERISTLKVNLRDISQNGMGLIVSENNAHLFKTGNLLELMELDEAKLLKPLLGKVVYANREFIRGQKIVQYRIGVKMLNAIPEHFLSKLTEKKSNRKMTAKDLFESDIFSDEFREMMSKEVAKELDKMKQRPAIMKYLNKLELVRGQDEYLEEHIKVLSTICTFIARSMNWVSEASLQKFVYASYLHDAPLFAHPKLARIRNLDEFELMKDQLTPEEQTLYLAAPQMSAQIALSDSGAPPDVSQMLIMQKELPNGQGFPHKHTFSKLTPMASLFIVAHNLTDEIMVNPDWDMNIWLADTKKLYKGGSFNKIFEALNSVKVTFKKK